MISAYGIREKHRATQSRAQDLSWDIIALYQHSLHPVIENSKISYM